MTRTPCLASIVIIQVLLLCIPTFVQAQADESGLEGMWSDPPHTIADSQCSLFCTDVSLAYLDELLDDPANDDRPLAELTRAAGRYQREQYFRPRFTAAALENYPRDPADDPGFLRCEPWGFAKQIFSPHQLEIRRYDDRVEMRYGEWEARRTVYLDGRERPEDQAPSPLGWSVGHYEGDTLVIKTSSVRGNLTFWGAEHSDQLTAVERYTRPDDGERLLLSVTVDDPWSLKQPVVLKKVWGWAPDQEISAYENCEPPTEFSRREDRP